MGFWEELIEEIITISRMIGRVNERLIFILKELVRNKQDGILAKGVCVTKIVPDWNHYKFTCLLKTVPEISHIPETG